VEAPAITLNSLSINGKSSGLAKKQAETSNPSFSDMLGKAVKDVNDQLVKASQGSAKMAVGKEVDITQTMIDIAKADLSFKLLLQVRNKALSAYEEVMRMQL